MSQVRRFLSQTKIKSLIQQVYERAVSQLGDVPIARELIFFSEDRSTNYMYRQ